VPTYTYTCTACNDIIEKRQSFSDPPLTTCEQCGGTLRKIIHPVGIVFKGSGFYITDSRSSTKSANGSTSSSESSGSKESSSSSSKESSDSSKDSSSSSSKSSSTSTPNSSSSSSSSSSPAKSE
jgi:putative FmdB family regulatory protein